MTRLGRAMAAVVLLSAAAGAAAAAEEAPATSVAGYGRRDAACPAWTDGCTICRRGPAGEPHCSTPGIACQPREVACETSTPERDNAAPR